MEYIALSPNIGVKSVDETVRFYTEILGFKLMTSVSSPKGSLQWAMVANGGATLMFQEIGNLLEECPLLSERPLLGVMTFYIKMKDMNLLYGKSSARCPRVPVGVDPLNQNKIAPLCQNKNDPCQIRFRQGIF